jgi:hypothetical protein
MHMLLGLRAVDCLVRRCARCQERLDQFHQSERVGDGPV